MRSIADLDLRSKKVLIRADLNVPLDENSGISDDNRIKQFLPTLQHVLKEGGIPIVISHLGRPGGQPNPEFSLEPVATRLGELAGTEVTFVPAFSGDLVATAIKNAEENRIVVLENLRFGPEERANDEEFAKTLASYCDVYINDAFATAHRSHASMVGVPALIKDSAPGYLMQKEIDYYKKALVSPTKPLCVVLGGVKVSTKLAALINIAELADTVIVGGAMANTFLAAQGIQMGRSLYEAELFPKAIELLGMFARRGCKVYLPVDFLVGPSPNAKGLARAVTSFEIPPDTMALDIGPATSILFKEALHSAETIIWNGPMGAYENEEYAKGTTDMCEHVAGAHGLTVVGGGDTDSVIHQMELEHKFDYISTGGGAFLTLLEGKTLPALAALE